MQAPPPNASSPASAAYPAAANTPALVALVASLIFPLAVAVDALVAFIIINHGPYILQSVAILGGGALSIAGLPATACAIVVGHVALVAAKRYPPASARRRMARVSLLLGYVSLAAWAVIFALFSQGFFTVRHANPF